LLAAAPAASAADRHGVAFRGHVAARGPLMRGGMHRGAGPGRFAGPHGEVHLAAGGRDEGHWGGDRGDRHWGGDPGDRHWGGDSGDRHWRGDRGGGHRGGPRYAVPPHWAGMHPHWEGPRPGRWMRPWGPRWVPHYWGGGDWGGRFWPHVYLGWDFPWFLAAPPFGSVPYWWAGIPYYYWQGVYYVWSPDYGQYVVTDPPPVSGGVEQGAAAPPPAGQSAQAGAAQDRGAMSLYVYPKNGQSEQQTANDRYQCHEWAVGRTGFDPTNPASDTHASTATPSNYKRAVTACLEARGYSVQ
ncbi:MAG: hypothetical protein ACRETZ_03165, partial [Steroidobacteraceae bacterium]